MNFWKLKSSCIWESKILNHNEEIQQAIQFTGSRIIRLQSFWKLGWKEVFHKEGLLKICLSNSQIFRPLPPEFQKLKFYSLQ